ncbi:MlaD family protein [Nitratifractor sp.]
MYSKINYTVVGLFVVLFTVALLGFGFWLAKYGFEQNYSYYQLFFDEPVDGLTLDSTVKLNGVEVGKVESIEIDPEDVTRTRVVIRLQEGTPVTKGMYGVLKLQGITGLSYVQIEGGYKGAPLLKAPKGEMPTIPTHSSLIYQLSQKAPELLGKLEKVSKSIEALFSEHNMQQITKILDHTAVVTGKAEEVEDRIISLSDELNGTLHRFDRYAGSITEGVNGVTKTLNEKLPPLMEDFDKAGERISQAADAINRKIRNGEYDLRKIVRPIKIDIQELSYRYQELAEDLKRLSNNPSSILFGSGHLQKGPGE